MSNQLKPLYEADFILWTQEQARKIRAGEPLDVENVADEIESLGFQLKREFRRDLSAFLAYRLKWEMQPQLRRRSWAVTLAELRHRMDVILEDAPSLRNLSSEDIAEEYAMAVLFASAEDSSLRNTSTRPLVRIEHWRRSWRRRMRWKKSVFS
jgi:hypothetical protein